MNTWIYLVFVLCTIGAASSGLFSEFAVTQGIKSLAPDLDEQGHLVWQQWYQDGASGDWDIHTKNLNSTDSSFLVIGWEGNQTAPSISGSWIVFEDEYAADDHDIYAVDTASTADPNTVAATELDERAPAIHGATVVWQRLYVDDAVSDWDLIGADITEPADPQIYLVAGFTENQQTPAVYRNTVVWQDDYYGDFDITSADVWLKNNPVEYPVSLTYQSQQRAAVWKDYVVWDEDFGGGNFDILTANIHNPEAPEVFSITTQAGAQRNPDIYEHLVVWQDKRNGNWDIYGYNLITRQEFQITNNASDQTRPAIGGGYVAWVDMRTGTESIYAAELTGAAVSACTTPPAGDTNGDCRVDLEDFLKTTESWLSCGLEYVEACGY
jgi:beta propeller repeat protein